MQARYYDPVIGRFLSIDPVGFTASGNTPGMFNRYSYGLNDPVNKIDPDGRQAMDAMYHFHFANAKAQSEGISYAEASSSLNATERPIAEASIVIASLFVPGPEDLVIAAAATTKVAAVAGKALSKTCCFVAGTLVDTETGLRPIEEIALGDRVWARDTDTGATELKSVTDLIRRHERVIWEVSLAGANGEAEFFETTDDHPWWIVDEYGTGLWLTTQEVSGGMMVITRKSGQPDGRIVITSVRKTSRIDATYNLTITDFRTYFVGKHRVLVHNCPTEGIYKFKEDKGDYIGQSGNVEKRLNQHVAAGRLDSIDNAQVKEVPGGRTAREVAEHKAIQKETGGVPASQSSAVTNKRDPIGPNRRDLLKDDQ